MVIKLFYHGHKCAEINVNDFSYNDIFSDGEFIGTINGVTVCEFDARQYDVVKTGYGFEVNKVV